MDAALSTLGIEETDIDELALGWTPREPRRSAEPAETSEANAQGSERADGKIPDQPTELSGLLAGRFDAARIAEHAAANGIVSIQVGELRAFCLGRKAAGACLAVLSESLAAFGEPGALGRLLETRAGLRGSLGADRRFTRLINEVDKNAPIWGMATGDTVAEWFRGWLPGQGPTQMDWKQAFDSVRAFTFSIDVSDQLKLTARLNGESAETARRLGQLFSNLRTLVSLLWQAQGLNQPNPLAGLQVSLDGSACVLHLTAALGEAMAYQSFPMRVASPTDTSANREK